MSGALKHFFDTIYYPCLDATVGRPYGVYVHGNDDTAGALRGIDKIVTGLRWTHGAGARVGRRHRRRSDDRDACWELGAAVAAGLMAPEPRSATPADDAAWRSRPAAAG